MRIRAANVIVFVTNLNRFQTLNPTESALIATEIDKIKKNVRTLLNNINLECRAKDQAKKEVLFMMLLTIIDNICHLNYGRTIDNYSQIITLTKMGLIGNLIHIMNDPNLTKCHLMCATILKRITIMAIVYGETQNLSYNEGSYLYWNLSAFNI